MGSNVQVEHGSSLFVMWYLRRSLRLAYGWLFIWTLDSFPQSRRHECDVCMRLVHLTLGALAWGCSSGQQSAASSQQLVGWGRDQRKLHASGLDTWLPCGGRRISNTDLPWFCQFSAPLQMPVQSMWDDFRNLGMRASRPAVSHHIPAPCSPE